MKITSRVILWFLLWVVNLHGQASQIYIPLDSVIKKSPVIIEGKVITVTPAYYAAGTIYTSYIIQVNKLFKGTYKALYIEVPVQGGRMEGGVQSYPSCGTMFFPGKGKTAIFFLHPHKSCDSLENNKFLNSCDTIAKHYIVHPYSDALLCEKYNNVEKDLYRHIEKITGQKRKIISYPEADDPDTRNWLFQNNKRHLLNGVGVSLNISHSELGNREKTFDLRIKAKSNTDIDLKHLEFAVSYNTKTFGTFAVKNNNVKINNINYLPKGSNTIPSILLGDSAYITEVTDLDSSAILISIKVKNLNKGALQIGNEVVAILEFNIKDFNTTTKLTFVSAMAKGEYYNYADSKVSDFSYIFCNKGLDVTPKSYLAPIVTDFSPDVITCGTKEVLTIRGKNFLSEKTHVLLWCILDECGFNGKIEKASFITFTDTTITLFVPCELKLHDSPCGSVFKTSSGFIVAKDHIYYYANSPRKLIIKHSE